MPKTVLFQMSFCLLMYNARASHAHPLRVVPGMRGEEDFRREAVLRREAAVVAVSDFVEVDSLFELLGEVPTAASFKCMRKELPGREAMR